MDDSHDRDKLTRRPTEANESQMSPPPEWGDYLEHGAREAIDAILLQGIEAYAEAHCSGSTGASKESLRPYPDCSVGSEDDELPPSDATDCSVESSWSAGSESATGDDSYGEGMESAESDADGRRKLPLWNAGSTEEPILERGSPRWASYVEFQQGRSDTTRPSLPPAPAEML